MKCFQPYIAYLSISTLVASCLLVGSAWGADLSSIREDIIKDTQSSQQQLNQIETDISLEKRALADKLNEAQNAIATLREQTVSARRLSDEQTLSLGQLEIRLKAWQEQTAFQSRLLASFYDQSKHFQNTESFDENDLLDGISWLKQYIAGQQGNLYPRFQTRELVMTDGELKQVESLSLGPVEWFWQVDTKLGGLVNNDNELSKVAFIFTDDAQTELEKLYQGKSGAITFDPTLSRAIRLEEEQESIMQHLEKGGIWVMPILLFALFASTVAIIKSFSLWRLPKLMPAFAARIDKYADGGNVNLEALRQKLQGIQVELFDISLQASSTEQRDDRLFACLLQRKSKLESWLGAIAVTAAVSPLLGLLGTVSGMITTFKLMTLFGAGDPASVSSGISEALVTTELGLIVAIPALLAHALMSRKVKSYYSQLETDAIALTQLPLSGKMN